FTRNGNGESVGGIVMMLKGENSNNVIRNIKDRIAKIQKSLPDGVTIVPFLDRSDMIQRTTSTVAENLALGALIVIFVLVVILGNIRGGLIVASTIPLSLLFTFIMMHLFGVWANLMSLGAIDFGILIDGSVIIVESTMYHLSSKKYIGKTLDQDTRDMLAKKSSSKMMQSAFFGQIIIMIVFVPILVLTGIEGKMFTPMAMTFSFAVLGVLILCLTYVPMMSSVFLRAPKNTKPSFGDRIVRGLERLYEPIVSWAIRQQKVVIIGSSLLLILSGVLFAHMGGEFLPKLDEGNIAMHMGFKPGTALSEVTQTASKIEKKVKTLFPDEVQSIQTRIGVADIPTDPMPMDIGDCFIILYPQDQWTQANSKEELVQKITAAVNEFPGVNYEFSQPIEMRFNELLTGVREDLAVKIYGENPDILAEKAKEVQTLIGDIKGVSDMRVEATKGLPQITIDYNRSQLAKYGVSISDINTMVETSFSGKSVGEVYEGEKQFEVVLRLDKANRNSIDDIKNLFITTGNNVQVPLSELATVSYQPGPMQISRENTNRRIYVGINVRDRDVKSLVAEISKKLDAQLNLPPGYYIRYGGAFENLERATNRLKLVVPIALAIIFLLVFIAIKSFSQTLMIYIAIPLSAVGGVFFLAMRGMPFSISAGVGFIVLFGVAVMNGLVLISSFNSYRSEGIYTLKEIITKGSVRRIRPILLTASTDILGFLPMAISSSAGAEIQRPLATVVIGGMFTATLLTLVVLPVLYYMVTKRSYQEPLNSNQMPTEMATNGNSKLAKIVPLLLFILFMSPLALRAQEVKSEDYLTTANLLKIDSLTSNQGDTLGSERIGISEVIEIAMKNYPSIRAANYKLAAQRDLMGTALDLGITTLSTSRDEYKNGIIGSQTLLSVSQDEINLLGIASKRKQQKAAIMLAQKELIQTKGQLVLNVHRSYHYTQNRVKKREIYVHLDSIYSRFAEASKLRYDTGETSKIEYLAASNKLGEVKLTIARLQNEVESAYLNLNQYLMIDRPFVVSLEMDDRLDRVSTLATNNEIEVSRLDQEVAKRIYYAEKAELLPKFSASFKIQKVDGVDGYNGFEVGLSVPLFNGQQSKIKAAKNEWRAKQADLARVRLSMQAQINQQKKLLISLEQRTDFYSHQAIPLANEQVEAAQIAYRLGEIDYIQFIQNIESSIHTFVDFIDLQTDYQDVIATIQYLSGKN
ncbi:MAG: CusA/CzcA family heavy metal efflux RND transporter, partial [Bacteroidaceae bacterium]